MIDLKPFYDNGESRSWLAAPWSRHGFTWATNGKILIRVPQRDDVPEATDKFEDRDRVLAIIATAEKATFHAFDWRHGDLENREPCKPCLGRGEGVKCETCYGSGEHQCDCEHCENECDNCHGTGFKAVATAAVIEADKRKMTCPTCQGTGLDPTSKSIYFDDVELCLGADLLDRILKLPGPIEMSAFKSNSAPQIFRGPEWLAALMPMRWLEGSRRVSKDIVVTDKVIQRAPQETTP